MRSVTKSIVALLYGILLARGVVPDVETSVVSLFPDYPEFNDPARRAIKIRHLLTMSSGLAWDEPSPVHRTKHSDEFGLFWRSEIFRYVFARDVIFTPGEKFVYSGGNTAVIAEIIARACKQSLREVARAELFMPLGITNWQWTENLFDVPIASSGLRLRPRDLMKIGMLMLDKGRLQSRQIVPTEWIDQCFQPQIRIADRGYGFQWWTNSIGWKNKNLNVAIALGNGGQTLSVVPDLDLAVVMTAGQYGTPSIFEIEYNYLKEIIASVTN